MRAYAESIAAASGAFPAAPPPLVLFFPPRPPTAPDFARFADPGGGFFAPLVFFPTPPCVGRHVASVARRRLKFDAHTPSAPRIKCKSGGGPDYDARARGPADLASGMAVTPIASTSIASTSTASTASTTTRARRGPVTGGVSTRRRMVFGAPMLALLTTTTRSTDRADASEIEITDDEVGASGTEPIVGIDVVKVNYAVKNADTGARVDSGKFFIFGSGGEVVRGFEACVYGDEKLGVTPMRVGGRRRMVVPASLGYGARGAGCDAGGTGCRVPPDSRLEFEVELVEVK